MLTKNWAYSKMTVPGEQAIALCSPQIGKGVESQALKVHRGHVLPSLLVMGVYLVRLYLFGLVVCVFSEGCCGY